MELAWSHHENIHIFFWQICHGKLLTNVRELISYDYCS